MRSKALFKLYLGRIIPLFVVVLILVALCGNEVVYHSGIDALVMIPLLALCGCVMFYMIRSKNDHSYVNSFPITKKQQWKVMYAIVMTMIAIVYAVYIAVVFIACHKGNGLGEIVISGLVKAGTAVFVTTFILWILGHTDYKFNKVLVGIVIGVVGLIAVAAMVQRVFNTGENNFMYQLKNYLTVLCIPVKVYNQDCIPDYRKIMCEPVAFSEKLIIFAVYMLIITILSIVCGFLACKNYVDFNLEKDVKKGYAKKFHPIIKAVFIAVLSMSILCGTEEIIGKFATEKIDLMSLYNDAEEFDKIPLEYWEYNDSEFVRYAIGDTVMFEGMEYKSANAGTDLVSYVVYQGEFSDIYKYLFAANGLVSVGIAVVCCRPRKKRG